MPTHPVLIEEMEQALPGPVLLSQNQPVATQRPLHSEAALLQTLQVACKRQKLSAQKRSHWEARAHMTPAALEASIAS